MRHRKIRDVVVVAATAAALAACDGGSGSDRGVVPDDGLPAPTPVVLSAAAAPAREVSGAGPGAGSARWRAPFDDVPHAIGGMFVGLVFPADDQADLSIIGVASDGSTRWAVRTNPSCVGYGVTSIGGTAAAVVLASDADSREGKVATRTSANAYDVRDGSRLWGPSPVPGPMLGPGLIFGQVTPSIVGGARGERVMLSAHSGEPVRPPAEEAVALYERHGTGLFGKDGVITAVDTATGTVLWDSGSMEAPPMFRDGPRHVELLGSTMASAGDVVALRWARPGGDGPGRTGLHELGTGRLIADLGDQPEFRTTVDRDTGTAVVSGLDQYRTTRAFDVDTGTELWRDGDDTGSVEITLVHDGTAYGTRAGRSVTVDVRTGNMVADGDWPVPVAAASDVLVAPLPPRPGAAPSDRTAGSGPGYVAYERQ